MLTFFFFKCLRFLFFSRSLLSFSHFHVNSFICVVENSEKITDERYRRIDRNSFFLVLFTDCNNNNNTSIYIHTYTCKPTRILLVGPKIEMYSCFCFRGTSLLTRCICFLTCYYCEISHWRNYFYILVHIYFSFSFSAVYVFLS